MKQEVRNVGKFSASAPSSGSNYVLYSSIESIKTGCYPNIRGAVQYTDTLVCNFSPLFLKTIGHVLTN